MSKAERQVNKLKLSEAKEKTENDSQEGKYIYKVRGPPWNRRTVRLRRAARHGRGRGGCGLGGSKDSNVNTNVNNCSSVDVSSLFCYYTNVDSLSNKWDEFCAGNNNMHGQGA